MIEGMQFENNAGTSNTSQIGMMPDFGSSGDWAKPNATVTPIDQKRGREGVAETIANMVKQFSTTANFARKSKDTTLIDKCVALGEKLLVVLWNLTKKALEMAVQKFVIELCAMVIAALGAVWANRGNKPFDISTPGVYFNNGTTQPAAATTNTTTTQSRQSSFGDPWSDWGSPSTSRVSSF